MIYLDNAATTPLLPDIKDYIISLLGQYQNPSSQYQSGIESRIIVNDARDNVAKFINADSKDIIFTSGGSASNTLAIAGYARKNNCTILYSPIAHKSVIECVKHFQSQPISVNEKGLINLSDLEYQLSLGNKRKLLVVDYANSEIGTIQNVEKIIMLAKLYHAVVYIDCTGSISQIPIDVKKLDVDMIGFSAHKLGALKGAGVLYKKASIELEPLIYGSQEKGLFSGTENVIGIAALGKAVENYDYSSITSKNRDYVYSYIKNNIPDSYLIGAPLNKNRLPHNLYLCFKGISGEALMILLDMNGIQVSTGSACNSGNPQASQALKAINMLPEDIHSCIRLTFNGKETKEELDIVNTQLKKCVLQLRNLCK